MKYYKYQIIFLIAFCGSTSCEKDFLDVPDKSALLRQAYVTDLKTTQDFLYGIYVELASVFYTTYTLIYPELAADNIKPVEGSPTLISHYNWVQQCDDYQSGTGLNPSESVNMNPVWLNGYRIIRSCSFILENVDKYSHEDEAKAKNIKGQAYALRALVHSFLVNVFAQSYNFTSDAKHAGIPYVITSNITDPVSRQTVSEVYERMISDLNNAIKLLPVSSSNRLFINHHAAKALLARIYLFKEDYTAAKNLAREVGAIAPIMTGANYPSKLFTSEETEALFQLPPADPSAANSAGSYNTYFPGSYYTTDFLQFLATNDIADLLNENLIDSRKAWISQYNGGWLISKYPTNVIPDFSWKPASYYQTLIRSSEMYLTAAESYVKLNNEDSAKFYLDAIRVRANPLAVPTSATGPALLDSVYKERQKEMAFEGLRLFDLLRWKKGVNRIDALNQTAQKLPYPSNKGISPIPLSDVTIYGLPQNPGY